MSFEYIIEKNNSKKQLSKEQEGLLVKNITSEFKSLNSKRAANLEMASSLANEIFFKNDFKSISDKAQKWKAKVKMCKTYMFYQTLKAFIWRNTYANVKSMFDVSGENRDSNNMSNKQKAMLVDILEKMDYQKTCDKVIDNALLYGELISFTAWKKKYEEYRRPVSFFQNLFSRDVEKMPRIIEAMKQKKNYFVDKKKIYDNPYIYAVNPTDLVFDSSRADDWDSCPKIYRTYKTVSEIINNQYYKLSEEEKEVLKSLVKNSSNPSSIRTGLISNSDVVKGSTIEVLEHWGDLKLPDGTVLKNWHAVVVAGKFLVEFGKNEGIINPFSYGVFIEDPDTKRGISPLYCVLSLAHFQEDLMNRTCNLQSLSENPPLLAPEGFFDEDEIELYPGKIIEYGDNLTPNAAFQQMQFNPAVFTEDISFLNDLMAEVSGIFPNMVGAVEDTGAKTATEINTKSQGQLTRLSMLVDTINQDFIIPNIEKVAKLCADFKSGVEEIFINKDDQPETIEIDDEVRQAEYKYTYSDSSNATLKSEQADMLVAAVEKFSEKIPLNLEEIFIWYFEQKGVDNPERFLSQQQEGGGMDVSQLMPMLQGMQGANGLSQDMQAGMPSQETGLPQAGQNPLQNQEAALPEQAEPQAAGGDMSAVIFQQVLQMLLSNPELLQSLQNGGGNIQELITELLQNKGEENEIQKLQK